MKVWKFEYKESDDSELMRPLYCLTEDGAKEVKKDLDRSGVGYNMASYGKLCDVIKNMAEWNDDNISDGEMLDIVLNLMEELGV